MSVSSSHPLRTHFKVEYLFKEGYRRKLNRPHYSTEVWQKLEKMNICSLGSW